MYYLENEKCKVVIMPQGGELCGFYDKEKNREYIWQAGEMWPRHAPVLFPAIGGFVEKSYLVNTKRYELPPHGFARDKRFEMAYQKADEICLELKNDEETEKMYPYAFCLRIIYKLEGKKLLIVWKVENPSSETMYYSIGAHPGFQLPHDTELTDYTMKFDKKIPLRTYRVKGRLVTRKKESIGQAASEIHLTPELFEKDALIFEEGLSSMTLSCPRADYNLKVSFPGFPVAAIWTPPAHADHAKFICIEPWVGINDFEGNEVKELKEKYLVETLDGNAEEEYQYTMEIL